MENIIIRLLKNNPFYGYFLMDMIKVSTNSIPTAGVGYHDGQFRLAYNKEFIESLNEIQQEQLLIHECRHILHEHLNQGFQQLSPSDRHIANLAMDIVVNQGLHALTKDLGITYERILEKLPDLEPNQNWTYYFSKLMEKKDEFVNEITIDEHTDWDEIKEKYGEELSEQIKRKASRSYEQARNVGNVGHEIEKLMNDILKSKVNWKQALKNFFTNSEDYNKTSTRKKRNRRYGYMFSGYQKEPLLNIAILIDESGSVYDKLFVQFWTEIHKIVEQFPDITLTIIQGDTKVNSVTPYKKGMEIKRTGCGGTLYNPMIEKAKELGAENIIFFGDGDCFEEQVDNPRVPFLWALADGCKAPAKFGKTVHIHE